VYDTVERVLCKEPFNAAGIFYAQPAETEVDERGAWAECPRGGRSFRNPELCQSRILEVGIIVVVDRIDPYDLVPALGELAAEVEPDEPSGPRHEDFHEREGTGPIKRSIASRYVWITILSSKRWIM